MKKIISIIVLSCTLYADIVVTKSEPVYNIEQQCEKVQVSSTGNGMTGALIGGTVGAIGGKMFGKLLGGKSGKTAGTLLGGGAGALIGAGSGQTQYEEVCKEVKTIKGYKNYYIKDNKENIKLSNKPLLIIETN